MMFRVSWRPPRLRFPDLFEFDQSAAALRFR